MTRSWWGWGDEDAALDDAALDGLAALIRDRFGIDVAALDPVPLDVYGRLQTRVEVPASLGVATSLDLRDRVLHARGNAFRDVVAAFEGTLASLPDAVLRPTDAAQVERVLAWCAETGTACVPYGGGSSVVGGVRPPPGPTISLDLTQMDALLDLDSTSLHAHLQAGALGPRIEAQLRPHGLTLRFYPQSWEFSTLGGWIATRAGGHDATLRTHIDDLTAAISAVTPTGTWSSRRLPASGAGPSPDRMLLGSEGTLGVITDAWMRVRPRPTHRARVTVAFPTFTAASAALRALAQSGLYPANCRLLDPLEALLAGAGDGTSTLLVLGFESADHGQAAALTRALELCADHRGTPTAEPNVTSDADRAGGAGGAGGARNDDDASAAWRRQFLSGPYLRDGLVRLGLIVETFETATTWDRFDDLVATLRETARAAATQVCGAAEVAVRVTHAYPDGAAPYFTVLAPGRPGERIQQWDTIKAAVSEAIVAAGATITHHHAVGRDHAPWYRQQVPAPFLAASAAVRGELDPHGIMNPGVLGTTART